MRTLLVFILILAVIVGAIALYLFATTPKESPGVTFPLSADQRALVERVPAGVDWFALIPTAGPIARKLVANPVTRGPFEQWTDTQAIPKPWMLGNADIVVWRNGKRTSYAIRVDTFRAFLVRIWKMWSSDVEARWDGTAFVINGDSGPRISKEALDQILEASSGLPAGDVFVVQMNRERGSFPPIGRPAASSIQITANQINTITRAKIEQPSNPATRQPDNPTTGQPTPITARFAKAAMLSATFAQPPRLLGDLQRFVGTNVGELVGDGGSIHLYDVDTGTLLPRPRGVISVPATDARRAAMADVIRAAELVGQSRDTGQELLVSFDRNSLPLYLKDAFVPGSWPATGWAVRVDPPKMVPVLKELGDSTGLRLASGRLHRAARDLRRWISALEQAESIEAATTSGPGFEELRVRIASK